MKRTILALTLTCAGFVTVGLPYGRLYATQVYGAPCGPVSGIAGFLQQTHFLPAGDCKTGVPGTQSGKGGRGCASAGSSCSTKNPVSGGLQYGTCQPQGNTCVCHVTSSTQP